MKKKLFSSIVAMVVTVITVYNVSLSTKGDGLSDISLANVEALAQESIPAQACAYYCCSNAGSTCEVKAEFATLRCFDKMSCIYV